MSDQTEREERYEAAIDNATEGNDCDYQPHGCHCHTCAARAVIALADQEQEALQARVRELEAALQQSRDDHQGAVEKLRAVGALADKADRTMTHYGETGYVFADDIRAALASPVESDAEGGGSDE
jgi:L-ascorbate metabolism protein UlaG (beta-lactamase superfamily)